MAKLLTFEWQNSLNLSVSQSKCDLFLHYSVTFVNYRSRLTPPLRKLVLSQSICISISTSMCDAFFFCSFVYLMVFCRSWSTPPLGKRVFRYLRISELIEPETKTSLVNRFSYQLLKYPIYMAKTSTRHHNLFKTTNICYS